MPAPRIPYALPSRDSAWMAQRAGELFVEMQSQRGCRDFSDRTVPRELIEQLVAIGNTAPRAARRSRRQKRAAKKSRRRPNS